VVHAHQRGRLGALGLAERRRVHLVHDPLGRIGSGSHRLASHGPQRAVELGKNAIERGDVERGVHGRHVWVLSKKPRTGRSTLLRSGVA